MKFSCILAAVTIGTVVVPAVAAEPGKPGGTLVIVQSQVPRHFNPAVQSGIATMSPGAQIFATDYRSLA